MKNNSFYVKIPGVFRVAFVVFSLPVCCAFLLERSSTPYLINDYYQSKLEHLKHEVEQLNGLNNKNAPGKSLKKQFAKTRKIYKELAVLTDYFNPYETKFLNGPAVKRVEEDNPDNILPPHGFQALEEYLFGKEKNIQLKISLELDFIKNIILQLENEKDRQLKFRDDAVFDALRAAVLRMITLGITGFDSPVAQNSVTEASSTIDGIRNLLEFYRTDLGQRDSALFSEIQTLMKVTSGYLSANNQFNSFNRLVFIKRFADPLYGLLTRAKVSLGLPYNGGRRPLQPMAGSVFSKDAFDIRFFSPDEQYQVTPQRVELGRMLFSDPILSGSKKRSCASCHKPELAFTDGLMVPLGMDDKKLLARNTPTLWNSALQTRQFFDSRSDALENQLDEVVHNADEMQGSLKQSVKDLKLHPVYSILFKKAYTNEPEPVTAYNIANAISSYIRTLLAMNARFDQYMRGDESKLNDNEKKGFNLFTGKAKCATCHFIPLFNGLVPPEFNETESEVIGVPMKGKRKVLDPDPGKYNFTRSEIHRHSFKIPTLRNIALTAPYMHNGVFQTLDQVIEFYNRGGGRSLNPVPENQTLPFTQLNLKKKEIQDLVSFLKTLTDTTYIYRP